MDPHGQTKIANLVNKVPRFAYTDNVVVLLNEKRSDYIRGIIFLPACIVAFFLSWAVVLFISKYDLLRCLHRNSSVKKKRIDPPKCCSIPLLALLLSFVSIAICSSFYITEGAFQTKKSFDIIGEEVRKFESIANHTKIIVTNLIDLQENAVLLTVDFRDLLNSTLYYGIPENKADVFGGKFGNINCDMIDDLAGVDIEALFDDGISKADACTAVIDALEKNTSKYSQAGGLDAFIADTGINVSKLNEINGIDEIIAGLGINAAKLGVTEWDSRALAHIGMNVPKARQMKDFDTFTDAEEAGRYLNIHELMINRTIEELGSLEVLMGDGLLDIMSAIEKATSVIRMVKKNLIKIGDYTKKTAFGFIPVLLLPLCMVVGLGVGRASTQPSKISGMYSRFLSCSVLPLFALIITCCIISFTVLGFGAVVTADVCISITEGAITKVMEEYGLKSGDFFYDMLKHFINSGCLSPSVSMIDQIIPQIEQATVDIDMLSLNLGHVCSFVDCVTIGELVKSLINVLTAVVMELEDASTLIKCDEINSIYTVIGRDEICANFLAGIVWMYSMLLLISFFGMIMITLRHVVWKALAEKINSPPTREELANLNIPVSITTGNQSTCESLALSSLGHIEHKADKKFGSSRVAHDFSTTRHSFISKQGGDDDDIDVKIFPKNTRYRAIVDEGSHNSKYHSKNDSVKTKDWDYTTTDEYGSNKYSQGDGWDYETVDRSVESNRGGSKISDALASIPESIEV